MNLEAQSSERTTTVVQPLIKMRLGVISFGLALGLTSAVFVFLLGMAAGLFGWGWVAVEVLASMFIGYSPTIVGSIAGAVWAFVDGFVAGALIAIFYNMGMRSRR